MSEPRGADGFVTINELRAHYVAWGPAEATPVVFLHGLRSYARTWEPVVAAMPSEYRAIALDHRGRGESDWDPACDYNTAAYVADVAAFADTLDLQRFALVGHSMGGINAVVYAAEHPERVTALIIEDIGPGSSVTSEGADRIKRELTSTPLRFSCQDEARTYWRSARPHIPKEALDSRVEHSLRQTPEGSWTWRFDLEGISRARTSNAADQVDLWPYIEALRCPTLVIRGARSDFLSAATAGQMQRRQQLVRVVDVPEAGHHVHEDDLSSYVEALQGFLRENAS